MTVIGNNGQKPCANYVLSCSDLDDWMNASSKCASVSRNKAIVCEQFAQVTTEAVSDKLKSVLFRTYSNGEWGNSCLHMHLLVGRECASDLVEDSVYQEILERHVVIIC
jgi:hypothetical protein